MQRLNIEDVRKAFDDRGDRLLSTVYVNAHSKIDYVCKNGHSHWISWMHYRLAKGCPACAGKAIPIISYVKSKFTDRGDVLLSASYINNSTKLDYICKNGHEHSISWAKYRNGSGCATCAGKVAPTLSKMRSIFANNGDTLLSENYINGRAKLDYICKNGHRHSLSWTKYKFGTRCPECANNVRLTTSDIRSVFASNGDTLLSESYVNSFTKLIYICKNGHRSSTCWSNYHTGHRCRNCAKSGFKPSEPAIFYYIRFEHGHRNYYKLGITNTTVKKRFSRSKIKPVIIYEQSYYIGQDALDREHKLLDRFSCFRLSKEHFKDSFDFLGNALGHTELFDFDVLNLDR